MTAADLADQHSSLSMVLDMIRRGRSSTRSQLAAVTGLGRKVVTQRVEELMQAGLIEEGALARSTGGRAPRELRFGAGVAHVLVADFNATTIAVGICDLSGTLLVSHEEPADVMNNAERCLARVEKLFDRMLAERPASAPPIWGIGLGVLGPVDAGSGQLIALPIMTGWRGYPVRERFSARYDVPVWVDNGVNLMALGEFRGGIGRDVAELIFIELGSGIGAGVISNGRLARGALGLAGELGHVVVSDDPDAAPCWCGNNGCVTQLAGGQAVTVAAEAAIAAGASPKLARLRGRKNHLTVADVTAAAGRGDPTSIDLIANAGRLIGRVSSILVTLYNPAMIIVGGELSRAGDVLLAAIRENVYRYSLPMSTRGLRIELSASSDTAVLIGAGFLVVDELLSPARLGRWIEQGSPVGRAQELHAAP